jgi:hypothetical protein
MEWNALYKNLKRLLDRNLKEFLYINFNLLVYFYYKFTNKFNKTMNDL